jgi:excisionase family DNA binding protein
MKPDLPPLDPWRADEVFAGDRKLWGAETIAAYLGVSAHTVYTLAQEPDVPIYKPGGRYFAVKSELAAWLRTKAPRDS